MMECAIIQDQDPRWDEFVVAHPAGTFFHLWAWRSILASSFDYVPIYLWVLESGHVRGVLPLFLVKSLFFGRSLLAQPFSVYGGIVATKEAAARMLLERATHFAHELGVRFLELRGNPYTDFDLACYTNTSSWVRKDLYATFIGEIAASDETNLARIPRKQRRMVRQGDKHGLRAVFDDERLTEFYGVYAASVRNLGTPVFAYSYFQMLCNAFSDRCKILLIEHKGKVISSVLSFFYRDQVLPYYGGALKESMHLAPNDFMYWELMRFAAARGCKIFDFGRSKVGTGAYDFKRHWGFEPKELPSWCYSPNGESIPDTSPMNPKLQWAVRVWRGLPLPLTMSLGPRIVRHVP